MGLKITGDVEDAALLWQKEISNAGQGCPGVVYDKYEYMRTETELNGSERAERNPSIEGDAFHKARHEIVTWMRGALLHWRTLDEMVQRCFFKDLGCATFKAAVIKAAAADQNGHARVE